MANAEEWRCDEHQQGTNTLERPPANHEVCSGWESDPIMLPCRWVRTPTSFYAASPRFSGPPFRFDTLADAEAWVSEYDGFLIDEADVDPDLRRRDRWPLRPRTT